ncbi:hypothetical protein MMC30_006549 [Trapelia coarctata]|nr:hypothetical protein [Trapelia coarctata]
MPLAQQPENYELLRRLSSDSDRSTTVTTGRPVPESFPGRAAYSVSLWVFTTFHNVKYLLFGYFDRRVHAYPYGRRPRSIFRTILRSIAAVVGFLFLLSLLRAIVFSSYQNPPAHYKALRDAVTASILPGRGNPYNEKIFIAANILQEDLIRGVWGEAVVELVDLLGEENVFVSIYENDSGPGTTDALKDLRNKLRCERSVVTGGHLPLDNFPTITLPSGEKRVKRIAYLSEVRNRALRPLDPDYDPSHLLSSEEEGFRPASITYDRVLFLNDIYFSPLSALQLLFSTNLNPSTARPSYRAACAVDFIGYAMFYDTFVSRDLEGFGMGLMFYPWFTPSGKAESRQDVLAGKDAVRVRSCWGGMIALQAAPFQKQLQRRGVSVRANTDVLRFRYEPELYWEGAECCLLLADLTARYPPPDSLQDTGIYINPFIRVAYKPATYSWIPFITRFERFFAILQNIVSRIGYPEYNPRREERVGEEVERKTWVYNEGPGTVGVGGSFHMVKTVATPGGFCGQRRVFVMLDMKDGTNKDGKKNWEKLPVPRG